MNPSSGLCRAQEKLHLERAASTSLANVRAIAERAAASWNKEALAAEKREQRVDQQSLTVKDPAEDERHSRDNPTVRSVRIQIAVSRAPDSDGRALHTTFWSTGMAA